jgi:hypothetical protein
MDNKTAFTTPYDPQLDRLSVPKLVDLWASARSRTVLAERGLAGELDIGDYWTELAVGTLAVDQIRAGRCCVVAQLLRHHAVTDWWQIGTATGMTETEARDGFLGWISEQVALRHSTGSIGITDAEADDLYALVEEIHY